MLVDYGLYQALLTISFVVKVEMEDGPERPLLRTHPVYGKAAEKLSVALVIFMQHREQQTLAEPPRAT